MSVLRFVGVMERFPRGYGIAYHCWDMDGCIAAPIPLNIVVRALHLLNLWLMHGGPLGSRRRTRFEAMLSAARLSGMERGATRGPAFDSAVRKAVRQRLEQTLPAVVLEIEGARIDAILAEIEKVRSVR